ncbi:DNA polymerase III subunit gamma and tau [Nocardia africana]|uniref:DNA polymerase III subunit gamma and tau n=1 Tax=Nocardia africana TaxID=134964 RepID=UPI000A00B328|nr:DNA polymerase III subunit gamma and tau [Nocardia africana]MCC3316403.1 DNA polymerase III subunit gamma and tau [Nocardia africana]
MALYRKYRPASFAEVVGQEHVTDPLSTALDTGRISHAYLFSGPRGCGKTSSARILARSLNCVEGPTSRPCGVCPSCVALAPGGPGNLDVIELDAASHGGVDDTRELRDRAFYAPAESRYRVFIVDEAHMVTTAGFNALLKIVEEPPAHLIFIFATTEPDKVLPTIRSRTHHYPFRLLPPATMRGLLGKICEQEQVQVEESVYPLVIRAGGGSPRDSLSVLDQLLAGAGPEGVTYPRALALLGVTDIALIDEAVDALAADGGAALFATIDRVVEAGHDPRRFATDLLERIRDLILLRAVPDAVERNLVTGPGDVIDRMSGQADRIGPATLARYAELLHEGLGEMRGATAPRLLLEVVCARMLLPSVSEAESAALQRLERLERRMESGGVPAAGPAAAPQSSAAPAAPEPSGSAARPSGEPRRRGAEALAALREKKSAPHPAQRAQSPAGPQSPATTSQHDSQEQRPQGLSADPHGAPAGRPSSDDRSAPGAADVPATGEQVAGPGATGAVGAGPADRETVRPASAGADGNENPTATTISDPAVGDADRGVGSEAHAGSPSGAQPVTEGHTGAAESAPAAESVEADRSSAADSVAQPESADAIEPGSATSTAHGGSVSHGSDAGAGRGHDGQKAAASRSIVDGPESGGPSDSAAPTANPGADRDSDPAGVAARSTSAPDAGADSDGAEFESAAARGDDAGAARSATAESASAEPEIRDESGAGSPDPAPAAPAEPAASPAEAGGDDVLREIEAAWADIRAKARESSAALPALLSGAVGAVRVEGDTIVFAHPHAPLAQRLSIPQNIDAVRAAVHAVIGRQYGVRWEVGSGDSGGARPGGAASERPARGGTEPPAGRNAGGGGNPGQPQPPRFVRPSQNQAQSADSDARGGHADTRGAAADRRESQGQGQRREFRPPRSAGAADRAAPDDDIPPPEAPDYPDDPGPSDYSPVGYDGVPPALTPEEEQEMLAESARPVPPEQRRDPDEVALELLRTELGATRLGG